MHSEMKNHGTTVKEYRKTDSKQAKEVAKEYSKSSKKAEKLIQSTPDQSELDEQGLIVIEREKADRKMYIFYLNSASKHINTKIVPGIYQTIQRSIDSKHNLSSSLTPPSLPISPKKPKSKASNPIPKT